LNNVPTANIIVQYYWDFSLLSLHLSMFAHSILLLEGRHSAEFNFHNTHAWQISNPEDLD